jgi:hypothetical protein
MLVRVWFPENIFCWDEVEVLDALSKIFQYLLCIAGDMPCLYEKVQNHPYIFHSVLFVGVV